MPASSQHAHPEHAPSALNPSNSRRSFTLPARATRRTESVPASRNTTDGIETLFVCSNSKIFSFTTAGPARRLSPSRSGDTSHPIPWKTPTERTLAVGMSSHLPPQPEGCLTYHRGSSHLSRDSLQRLLPQQRQPPAHNLPPIPDMACRQSVRLCATHTAGLLLSHRAPL